MRAITTRLCACGMFCAVMLVAGCRGTGSGGSAGGASGSPPAARHSSQAPAPTTPPSPPSLTEAQLARASIQVADLPAGYRTEARSGHTYGLAHPSGATGGTGGPGASPPGASGGARHDCTNPAAASLGSDEIDVPDLVATFEVSYTRAPNAPSVRESLTSTGHGGATAAYAAFATALGACPTWTVPVDRTTTVRLTNRRIPFPRFGDATTVYRQQGTFSGALIQSDVVLCRVGDVVLNIEMIGGVGPVPTALEQKLVRATVGRVRAAATR